MKMEMKMMSPSSPVGKPPHLSSFPKSRPSHPDVENLIAHRLQTCSRSCDLRLGRALHARLLRLSILPFSLFLQNHLLNMYFKCSSDPSHALNLFDTMSRRNIVTWSASVAGLLRHNRPQKALSLFIRMCRHGLTPNHFTLVSALHASSLVGDPNCSPHVFAQVLKLGFESNVFLINAFLTGLVRNRRFKEAFDLFEEVGDRDVVSWNSMMVGFLDQGDCSGVWGFWCRMMREGPGPDEFSFSGVLTGLATACSSSMGSGVQVHAQLVKHGFGHDICVRNSLVDFYLKNRDLTCGFKAFNEMLKRDVVSWSQMAAGCLDCGQPSKALEVVREMKLLGVMPNKFTLATAFNACSSLASLEEGQKAHGFRVKQGDNVDICVDNASIDMYAKCGSMQDAMKLFCAMEEKCSISWTTLIKGFAQNGLAQEALNMFEEMIMNRVEPNNITMICVLYACGQGGFVDEGWRYFTSMEKDYGISPGEDHYACMVDLLGKAGKILEAEALILSNKPFSNEAPLWKILLGACRLHGDVETGKRAAEKALALEKDDASTYVLLSNIYADKKIWDGVDRVRDMGYREVNKMPGYSWIG